MTMAPTASVIVCTRNRAISLGKCLDSIVADTSTAECEIIVVDNGSTDETLDVIERRRAAARPRPLTLVREPQPGLSRARNAGIAASTGRYVLFTDDDVTVCPGWIDAMVAAFAENVAVVAGRIHPRIIGEWPSWLLGYDSPVTLGDYGETPFELTPDRLPLGANMAFDGNVLRVLPTPFDPRLGHTGKAAIGGDEFHLAATLLAEGHRGIYAPGAQVEHWAHAARWTYPEVRMAFYLLGIGIGRRSRIEGKPMPTLPRRAVRLFKCWTGARRLRWRNSRKPAVTSSAAQEEFMATMWLGLHVELLVGASQPVTDMLARLPVP